jgi:thiol-disulfide isomerase/thioredoxin
MPAEEAPVTIHLSARDGGELDCPPINGAKLNCTASPGAACTADLTLAPDSSHTVHIVFDGAAMLATPGRDGVAQDAQAMVRGTRLACYRGREFACASLAAPFAPQAGTVRLCVEIPDAGSQSGIAWYLDTYFGGMHEVAGRSILAGALEESGLLAMPNRILLDLNGDGLLEAKPNSVEYYYPGQVAEIGGKGFVLTLESEPSLRLRLTPTAKSTRPRPPLTPGSPAPRFRVKSLRGKTLTPTLPGKSPPVTILYFWASWCAPCNAATDALAALQAEIGPARLRVVGVSLDEDRRKAVDYVARQEMSWENHWGGPKNDVAVLYRVFGLPTVYAIDHQGTLRGDWQGINGEVERVIRRLCSEQ